MEIKIKMMMIIVKHIQWKYNKHNNQDTNLTWKWSGYRSKNKDK